MFVSSGSYLPSYNQVIVSNPLFHNLKLNLICPHSSSSSFTSTSIQNSIVKQSACSKRKICCSECGRRSFLATTPLHLLIPSYSIAYDQNPMAVLNRVHPPRPDWYEEFYAAAMDTTMKSYESEIAGYKSQLFANLTQKAAKVLELGIGTGPNLKYYTNAAASGVSVIGVDPNRKMEKYAQAAAQASGLPQTRFKFIHAVAESLPVSDASMDVVVVGTLVLCSVKDVDKALQEIKRVLRPGGLYIFVEHVAAKDGTLLKVIQRALDPLQQTVADGCHLTRETGDSICAAGFSSVDMRTTFLSSASLVNPNIYGIAYK